MAGEECMVAKQNEDFVLDAIRIWRSENLISFFLDDIQHKVKRDRATKVSVYVAGLSAFTGSPINLFLRGESSIGKTYNTMQALAYFPQDMVIYLGGMSQKSLIHEHGILLNKNGEEIDIDNRPVKPKKRDYDSEESFNEALAQYQENVKLFREEMQDSYTLVDVTDRILVFLETPSYETLHMLKPILSHDKLEIPYKFVDKTGKGSMKTMNVRIRGWPAAIFLTVDRKYMEEIATRSFSVTPEDSDLKRIEANMLTNQQLSYPWEFEGETKGFKVIQQLLERLKEFTENGKVKVVIPFPDLHNLFPHEINRDMRDFQHFGQFLATITLLHYFQRPYIIHHDTRYLIAVAEDVRQAYDIYQELLETTRTGTDKRILDFYHIIVKTKDLWYLKNLTEAYNSKYRKKLSEASIRNMLTRLDQIGYVNIRKDDTDIRTNVFIPLKTEDREKLNNVSKLDSKASLEAKLENSFKTWLTRCSKNTVFFSYKNNPAKPGTWGESELTIEELSGLVMNGHKQENISVKTTAFLEYPVKAEATQKTEIQAEDTLKSDSKANLNISTEQQTNLGIPCPHCQGLGKKAFFANDVDLRIHISAYHETQEYVR